MWLLESACCSLSKCWSRLHRNNLNAMNLSTLSIATFSYYLLIQYWVLQHNAKSKPCGFFQCWSGDEYRVLFMLEFSHLTVMEYELSNECEGEFTPELRHDARCVFSHTGKSTCNTDDTGTHAYLSEIQRSIYSSSVTTESHLSSFTIPLQETAPL